MWFITLIKLKKAPANPAEAEKTNKMMMDAAKSMGLNVKQGFMTLGAYDMVWIAEGSDISAPMRMSMMGAETAQSETLVGVSYDEAMSWLKKMPGIK